MQNSIAMKMFVAEVLHLASSPNDQERIIRELGDSASVDELAEGFSESFKVVLNHLDEPSRSIAQEIEDQLEKMSSRESLASEWSYEALYNSTNWSRVRQLARELLPLINCE